MVDKVQSDNITWHHGEVTAKDRERAMGHKAAVLWFTGLPSSGKSTLARAVEEALFDRNCHTYVLDGDNVRHGLNGDLGFTPEDRVENIRRIGEVAMLFHEAGLITMTAFISPYKEDRDRARAIVGDAFIEVYIKADLATCEERDPKGLYKKARSGEIPAFTGVSAPYEAPVNPEVVVDTVASDLAACTAQVIQYLESKSIL